MWLRGTKPRGGEGGIDAGNPFFGTPNQRVLALRDAFRRCFRAKRLTPIHWSTCQGGLGRRTVRLQLFALGTCLQLIGSTYGVVELSLVAVSAGDANEENTYPHTHTSSLVQKRDRLRRIQGPDENEPKRRRVSKLALEVRRGPPGVHLRQQSQAGGRVERVTLTRKKKNK